MVTRLCSITCALLLMSCQGIEAGANAVDGAIPITGDSVPGLAAFDEAMLTFMAEHDIQAGVLTVSRHGKVLLSRGYGWRDARQTQPTQPDTPMRLASVSKPIVAALVRDMYASGQLEPHTPALPLLPLNDPPAPADERWQKITIDHLLHHRGGWDRASSGEPTLWRDDAIQQALHIDRLPDAHDVIRFMLARPLDFTPGQREVYSNFGYCLLGRVLEGATDMPLIDLIHQRIAQPLDMPSLQLGRTYARDRHDHEVSYPIADGSLHIERMDAHGGLIANAPDICRFLEAYWITGHRRDNTTRSLIFFGYMPGTTALARQLPDGTNYVALFNASPRGYRDIRQRLDHAANAAGDRP